MHIKYISLNNATYWNRFFFHYLTVCQNTMIIACRKIYLIFNINIWISLPNLINRGEYIVRNNLVYFLFLIETIISVDGKHMLFSPYS